MKATLLCIATLFACILTNAQVSVLTKHNNLYRNGWYNRETILSPSNVNVRQFGKIFSLPVDDNVFAQPLILSNVTINNGKHNIVIIATVNSTVYAYDADNGNLFWSKNYTPAGLRTVQNTDFIGTCNGRRENTDFARNVGIVGTPVIDSVTQTLYFVERNTDAAQPGIGNFYTVLHAVSVIDGSEKINSPVSITGSVPGSGSDAIGGMVPFYPQHQNQRLALTLYNGIVFIGFSSQCDWIPYHGWIFGYDAATLQQKYIYNTTPKAMGGGIWESGGGIVVDDDGYLYLCAANGYESPVGYNGNPSDMINRAQSAIKLKITDTALVPVDFFTPSNFKTLNEGADLDFGSFASFIIPDAKTYVVGDKGGHIFLLNTDSLGGFNATKDKTRQSISLGTGVLLRCQPAYYRSTNHEYVYAWSQFSQLKSFPYKRTLKQFDLSNMKTGLETADPLSPNISTSSNGMNDGTGIVWISKQDINAVSATKPQILVALDANDITHELWNSTENLKRDSCGSFMKFASPAIANGKVYLANSSNHVNVFGIVDTVAQAPDCLGSDFLSFGKNMFASSSVDNNHLPSNANDNDTSTQWISELGAVQWIAIDLGQKDSICNVSFSGSGTNGLGRSFQVQVSDDSANWTTVKSVVNNLYPTVSLNVKTAGRYVRLYASTRISGSFSIKEFTVYGSQILTCKIPAGLTVNDIDVSSAVIRWYPSAVDSFAIEFKPAAASLWQEYHTGADSLIVNGLSCNTYYKYQLKAFCAAASSPFTQIGNFNTLECNKCILPTRTEQTDIGDVGLPGHGCFFNPDKYNINGSGKGIGDISGTDGFHFVYKDFLGNGELETKITFIDSSVINNNAGIMFRESLDADARFVYLGINTRGEIALISRQQNDSISSVYKVAGFAVPYSLKIVKTDTKYTAYIAAEKQPWTAFASVPNTMQTSILYAGLCNTSMSNTQFASASFKGLIISSYDTTCGALPNGYTAENIGKFSLPGSACYYYGANRYIVNGGGTNIDNTADSFFYIHRSFIGNKTITAKVTQQDNSNPDNKAGIMIRWGINSDQKNIFVGITSGNGAVFQYRKGKRKTTKITYIPGISAPYYVRLVKSSDSLYTGYISADANIWQKIGDVTIASSISKTKLQAGMAVCSGDASLVSHVIFDDWLISDSTVLSPLVSHQNSITGIYTSGNSSIANNILKVYPNPAVKNFIVEFNIRQKQDVFVSIVNTETGATYFSQNLLGFAGAYFKTFNDAAFPRGTYMVSVKTKEGIVKQVLIKE